VLIKFRIFIYFTFLFFVVIIFLKQFQLHGMTDSTYYLQPLYNMFNMHSIGISIDGGLNNFLGDHFNPYLFLFIPFAGFMSPIIFLYFLLITAYLPFFIILYNLYEYRKNTFYDILLFFIFIFSIPTLFFNFYLNYNGYHPVVFAPMLILSYYYLLVEESPKKSILFFLPFLLIKEEFWLIFIFFAFALFIRYKQKKYFLLAFINLLLFIGLYKYMAYINGGEQIHNSYYVYLYNVDSISDFIDSFMSLDFLNRRMLFMSLFFVPFLVIIDFKRISFRDLVTTILIIGPTFAYCFLSKQTPMSYWLFEHYSLPVLPIILTLVIKYGIFSKKRMLLFISINILLIIAVISQKQPWQYKYYQDEKQLLKNIMPKLDLEYSDFLLSDDRTGVYFSQYQVDYISLKSVLNSKYGNPKYIVINTRYTYSAINLKYDAEKMLSSYEYVNQFNMVNNFKLIYKKYPFLIFEYKDGYSFELDNYELDNWDKKTVESNKWF